MKQQHKTERISPTRTAMVVRQLHKIPAGIDKGWAMHLLVVRSASSLARCVFRGATGRSATACPPLLERPLSRKIRIAHVGVYPDHERQQRRVCSAIVQGRRNAPRPRGRPLQKPGIISSVDPSRLFARRSPPSPIAGKRRYYFYGLHCATKGIVHTIF